MEGMNYESFEITLKVLNGSVDGDDAPTSTAHSVKDIEREFMRSQ